MQNFASYQKNKLAIFFKLKLDEDGIDSLEHTLMESEFGAICTRFTNIVWCLRDVSMWKAMMGKRAQIDPEFGGKGVDAFPEFVNERRKAFVTKYPQFE